MDGGGRLIIIGVDGGGGGGGVGGRLIKIGGKPPSVSPKTCGSTVRTFMYIMHICKHSGKQLKFASASNRHKFSGPYIALLYPNTCSYELLVRISVSSKYSLIQGLARLIFGL